MTVASANELRRGCSGVAPLEGRLEPWQIELCSDPNQLTSLLEEHGSPVNLLDPAPMGRNARELREAASESGLDLGIYFARKSNKALGMVDEAMRLGLGIDLASRRELEQALDRGVPADRMIMSAAIKPRDLLELCVRAGVEVVVDNRDELQAIASICEAIGTDASIAPRLAARIEGRDASRFGSPAESILSMLDEFAGPGRAVSVGGIHFHLDGYATSDRAVAMTEAFDLVEALRRRGSTPRFVDIGGGIPIRYLDSEEQWDGFWSSHREALLGRAKPLTYRGHGLGLSATGGTVSGRPDAYPSYQHPTRGEWLRELLAMPLAGEGSVADGLLSRGLELHCEPGRSLMDGCGITATRVEYRKPLPDGSGQWLIGLAMNRTQCRSNYGEFLVDPLLVRPGAAPHEDAAGPGLAIEGFLVGAYCVEAELISRRRLRFPRGVAVGDIVIFPNTGGYLMHILESASHQIPLARNLLMNGRDNAPTLDPIDSSES